jgi:hypothetical protein
MARIPLLFEDAELRAHRRIGRRAGERSDHFVDPSTAEAIQDVHDLALTPAQTGAG